jgi:polyphosphate glucokinase
MPKNMHSAEKPSTTKAPRTLAIDIGGSGLKAVVLDPSGKMITERKRIATPRKATPRKMLRALRELAAQQGDYDRVSTGFPGVVKDGVVYTAANLGRGWRGYDLADALQKKLKRPVRIENDADVQGMGDVSGQGVELVITLGTGFGSVLFVDGRRLHLELGHHPFHRGKTYEEELGRRALDKKGRKKWNRMLVEAIDDLRRTFGFDRLYIGGGNTNYITVKLPADVQTVSNKAGLLGGIALWKESAPPRPAAAPKTRPGSAASGRKRAGGTFKSTPVMVAEMPADSAEREADTAAPR